MDRSYTCRLMDVIPVGAQPNPLTRGQLNSLQQTTTQRELIAKRRNLYPLEVPLNLSGLDMPVISLEDLLNLYGYQVPDKRSKISQEYVAPYNLGLWFGLLSITRNIVNNRVMTPVLPANNQTDRMLQDRGTSLETISQKIMVRGIQNINELLLAPQANMHMLLRPDFP